MNTLNHRKVLPKSKSAAEMHAHAMEALRCHMEELQALVDADLGATGTIDYSHVGTAQRVNGQISDLVDMLKGRGEYAA